MAANRRPPALRLAQTTSGGLAPLMLFWLKKFISFWLMPLQVGLLLVVAGIWLIRRGRRPRLGRTLVFAGAGLVLVLSQSLVSKALTRSL